MLAGMHLALRRRGPGWRVLGLAALLALATLLPGAGAAAEVCTVPPPAPGQRDPDALWRIVHCHCVPAARAGQSLPPPCIRVGLVGGAARGFAVIKDRRGQSQYLLIPTARISGIEDPALLAPGAPPYLAEAWRVRGLVGRALGRRMARDELGLAVNAAVARTQNQLHIHLDCLRAELPAALRAAAPEIGDAWRPLSAPLVGRSGWWARRLAGRALPGGDPFALLAELVAREGGGMGEWTLALAGLRGAGGAPGFVLLAGREAETGDAERLLDHGCSLAATAPALRAGAAPGTTLGRAGAPLSPLPDRAGARPHPGH